MNNVSFTCEIYFVEVLLLRFYIIDIIGGLLPNLLDHEQQQRRGLRDPRRVQDDGGGAAALPTGSGRLRLPQEEMCCFWNSPAYSERYI